MLDELVKITVAKVRQRASEGDCPITAPYSVEHLETTVIDLADKVERVSAPLKEMTPRMRSAFMSHIEFAGGRMLGLDSAWAAAVEAA